MINNFLDVCVGGFALKTAKSFPIKDNTQEIREKIFDLQSEEDKAFSLFEVINECE